MRLLDSSESLWFKSKVFQSFFEGFKIFIRRMPRLRGVGRKFKASSLKTDSSRSADISDGAEQVLCGGFWSPFFHDLYCGEVGAIANHLEIDQSIVMKLKGLILTRTNDIAYPFKFNSDKRCGYPTSSCDVGGKVICNQCTDRKNHSIFRRSVRYMKNIKSDTEKNMFFSEFGLSSFNSKIDNLSRNDAITLIKLITQGNLTLIAALYHYKINLC